MATKKTAAKKTATKTVTRRSKKVLHDGVYYVVSQRNRVLGYSAVALFENRADAESLRNAIEANSILSYRAAKIERVLLAVPGKIVGNVFTD